MYDVYQRYEYFKRESFYPLYIICYIFILPGINYILYYLFLADMYCVFIPATKVRVICVLHAC